MGQGLRARHAGRFQNHAFIGSASTELSSTSSRWRHRSRSGARRMCTACWPTTSPLWAPSTCGCTGNVPLWKFLLNPEIVNALLANDLTPWAPSTCGCTVRLLLKSFGGAGCAESKLPIEGNAVASTSTVGTWLCRLAVQVNRHVTILLVLHATTSRRTAALRQCHPRYH